MRHSVCSRIVVFVLTVSLHSGMAHAAGLAEDILKDTGVAGGLVIHLGCGDGCLTAALRAGDKYLIQGLAAEPEDLAAARAHIQSLGLYGKVTVALWRGARLPYVDNLVNLVVTDDLGKLPMDEVMRVLAPNGIAWIGGKKTVKPWPKEIDGVHTGGGPGMGQSCRSQWPAVSVHHGWQSPLLCEKKRPLTLV